MSETISVKRVLNGLDALFASLDEQRLRSAVREYARGLPAGARTGFLEDLTAACDPAESVAGDDTELIAAIEAFTVDAASGMYYEGCGRDPQVRHERAFGDEAAAVFARVWFDDLQYGSKPTSLAASFSCIYSMMHNLSETFGEPTSETVAGAVIHAFPTAARMARAADEELRACEVGFRVEALAEISAYVVEVIGRLYLKDPRASSEQVTRLVRDFWGRPGRVRSGPAHDRYRGLGGRSGRDRGGQVRCANTNVIRSRRGSCALVVSVDQWLRTVLHSRSTAINMRGKCGRRGSDTVFFGPTCEQWFNPLDTRCTDAAPMLKRI